MCSYMLDGPATLAHLGDLGYRVNARQSWRKDAGGPVFATLTVGHEGFCAKGACYREALDRAAASYWLRNDQRSGATAPRDRSSIQAAAAVIVLAAYVCLVASALWHANFQNTA